MTLPVRFFFRKDGSFDGIEIYVEHALERDIKLSDELLRDLSKALDLRFGYTIERDK